MSTSTKENQRTIVVAGYGPAGMTAAAEIRRRDKKTRIVIIDNKSVDIYHPCATPYTMGNVHDVIPDDLTEIVDDKLYDFEFHRQATLSKINRRERTVEIKKEDGNLITEKYDELILSLGSESWVPPIPGRNLPNVHSLKWIDDCIKILNELEESSNIVVVGGSAIGIEVAAEIATTGRKVTLLEAQVQLLPQSIDNDISIQLKKTLENEGVEIHLKSPVKKIVEENGKAVAVETNENSFPADFVIMATGVRPNVKVAKEAGLEIGELNGIKVSFSLRTSDRHIWAAGDCVETVNLVTKKPSLAMLAGSAVRMGRIVGANMTSVSLAFPGALNSFIVTTGQHQVGSVGMTAHEAKKAGYTPIIGKIRTHNLPKYMPEAKKLCSKIVADKYTGVILGAQLIGGSGISESINITSLAIQNKMSLEEFVNSDICYAPAVNDVIIPIVGSAMVALRRL
jgi:NADH oxidase (H2O2-forming)